MSSEQSIPPGAQHGASQVPHTLPSLSEDLAALEAALIENKVAQTLNPVEEARACATLMKELGLTHEQMGKRIGRPKSAVSQMMRLLNLSEEIIGFLERGELSVSNALRLMIVKDLEVRGQLARAAAAEGWSDAALRARVRERENRRQQGLDDATILAVAKAWKDVLNVEMDVRAEPHDRFSIKLNFTSAEAALASAGQLNGSPDQGKEARSGSDCKNYAPREILQRARALAWATALGAITAEALAERDELSIDVARGDLDEAVGLGLMESHSLLVGYPALYTATSVGRRVARKHAYAGGYAYPKRLRPCRVNIREARHMIACAGVVAALEHRYPGSRVIGERELHREESRQGRRLGTVEVCSGKTRSHSPDIVIWEPSKPGESPPLPIAVEVELTRKGKEVRTAICRAWADARHIKMVLYYAETAGIENVLLDTIEELKAEEMIVVKPLSEILKPLPGFDLSREAETVTDH